MKLTIQIITLLASAIALVTAAIGLRATQRNAGNIAQHFKEIEALKKAASKVALSLTIDVPREGDVIDVDTYDDMCGTFAGDIPEGYRLWVLAREQFNFFLMYPPTQFTRTMGRWSQTNVRLNTAGRWELHVCLANDKASEWFQGKADRNDWSGFPTLPDGAETVRYVLVQKK